MRWTLPNILTVGRLLAAPALPLAFVILLRPWSDLLAFVLFVGAAVTDWFDGYLARKWKEVSRFGAMLDPIADKAMVIIATAMLMGLFDLDALVIVPAAIILFREVFVSGLREFLGQEASGLQVTKLAKWKTTVQMVAVSVLLLHGALAVQAGVAAERAAAQGIGDPWDSAWTMLALTTFWGGIVLLWAAAALTAITGWDYFSKARPLLGDER